MQNLVIEHVITEEDLLVAARRLCESRRGRNTLTHLLDWLDGEALGLDGENVRAVMTLLAGAFGRFPGSTREMMRTVLGK
jgi:hypothetical protein